VTGLRNDRHVLEIACDESGYEGENLIGATTDVFAHASVRLRSESATDCILETRERIRSPAREYKSNHLLREKHRSVLEWLLGPSGPIHGNAHVHLTDKTFFVAGKVVDLLIGEVTGADDRAIAVTLYREGRRTLGREPWEAFLKSFNDLMRPRNRRGARMSVDEFFGTVDVLRPAAAGSPLGEIIELLWEARPRADAVRARLLDDPRALPALDPLLPAIVQAVVHWGEGGRPVAIVHDAHTTLTAERIARITELLGPPRPRLAGLRLVDSRADARVQVADFLAGVARKIASDELNDRGDPALTALLRPYVDPCSTWADDRSWSLLAPTPSARS
jgi:hypothetical protein